MTITGLPPCILQKQVFYTAIYECIKHADVFDCYMHTAFHFLPISTSSGRVQVDVNQIQYSTYLHAILTVAKNLPSSLWFLPTKHRVEH